LNYFGEEEWLGAKFTGEELPLARLPYETLLLNVYAPDCIPCWKEIPTLNYIQDAWISKVPSSKLYMIVDPYQISPESAELPWEGAFAKAKARMEEEIKTRGIRAEVLIMKPPFRVGENGLVTGTPETLVLRGKPLRLDYNFVGSICEETKPEQIANHLKVKFMKQQLGWENL